MRFECSCKDERTVGWDEIPAVFNHSTDNKKLHRMSIMKVDLPVAMIAGIASQPTVLTARGSGGHCGGDVQEVFVAGCYGRCRIDPTADFDCPGLGALQPRGSQGLQVVMVGHHISAARVKNKATSTVYVVLFTVFWEEYLGERILHIHGEP